MAHRLGVIAIVVVMASAVMAVASAEGEAEIRSAPYASGCIGGANCTSDLPKYTGTLVAGIGGAGAGCCGVGAGVKSSITEPLGSRGPGTVKVDAVFAGLAGGAGASICLVLFGPGVYKFECGQNVMQLSETVHLDKKTELNARVTAEVFSLFGSHGPVFLGLASANLLRLEIVD